MSIEIQTELARSVWNESENKDYIHAASHWRGIGCWENDNLWQGIGKQSVSLINELVRRHGQKPNLGLGEEVFLEWGPGGGANLYSFAPFSKKYIGIDVSQDNLEEASRMISEEGHSGVFEPVLLSGDPLDVVNKIAIPVDYFLSTAVFQHFPSKIYGEKVLKAIYEVSKPGALGFIQIRFDNGNEKFKPNASLDDYKKRHIYANSYQIDEFWDLACETGFEVFEVRDLRSKTNYCTFTLRRP